MARCAMFLAKRAFRDSDKEEHGLVPVTVHEKAVSSS